MARLLNMFIVELVKMALMMKLGMEPIACTVVVNPMMRHCA